MFTIVGILTIIVSLLLILVVLIQNPKGGGLTATFGGVGNQILGANRSTDIVEKATWYLAGALIVLALGSIFVLPNGKEKTKAPQEQSEVEKALKEKGGVSPVSAPAAPVTAPPANTAPATTPAAAPTNEPAASTPAPTAAPVKK